MNNLLDEVLFNCPKCQREALGVYVMLKNAGINKKKLLRKLLLKVRCQNCRS